MGDYVRAGSFIPLLKLVVMQFMDWIKNNTLTGLSMNEMRLKLLEVIIVVILT